MVTRFMPPKAENDVDQIATMPFEDCLTDLDGIDISNTTAFDVFMAMVELEHGLKQLVYTNQSDAHVQGMVSMIHEINPQRSR